MPYPKGHMEKVRGHIIESAAKAFRTNGIRDISVPAIMKGAGLTHGGSIPILAIKSSWSWKLANTPYVIPFHFCSRRLIRR